MFEELKENIQVLIANYEKVKEANNLLLKELNTLKGEKTEYIKQIEELKRKIDSTELLNAFNITSSGSEEAKQRIEKLIKKIDNCLSIIEN